MALFGPQTAEICFENGPNGGVEGLGLGSVWTSNRLEKDLEAIGTEFTEFKHRK